MAGEHGEARSRREILGLVAAAAGVAVAGAPARGALGRLRAAHRGIAAAAQEALGPAAAFAGALPACVVRPEQTEGPFFVDERLLRSDIRSDPSDGSIRDGVRLALTFTVSRIDGDACVPLAGVLVDVWHCDAAGTYSGVQDPGFDTRGRKFLRGYQITDAAGGASFVTIYPGWYQGRTVHVHFKLRTEPAADRALEFTSQLYFDDAVTDAVHAQQPYAAEGQRTIRNQDDGIYRGGGAQLLVTPSADGSGGYAATFAIGIAAASGACTAIADCLTNLAATLPDPANASSRPARRTAQSLHRRTDHVVRILARAGAGSPARQARRYQRARARLQALLTAAEAADGNGTLGVPLATLRAAIERLLAQLPA
jgi:protocatechuate 3,4-dioxygenase beta subunit